MTKIEEILNRNFELIFINDNKCEPDIESLRDAVATGLDYETLINSIKEYAEWYAEKCLEVAAENATGPPMYDYSNPYTTILLEDRVNINFDSILNIKLPDHE